MLPCQCFLEIAHFPWIAVRLPEAMPKRGENRWRRAIGVFIAIEMQLTGPTRRFSRLAVQAVRQPGHSHTAEYSPDDLLQ